MSWFIIVTPEPEFAHVFRTRVTSRYLSAFYGEGGIRGTKLLGGQLYILPDDYWDGEQHSMTQLIEKGFY